MDFVDRLGAHGERPALLLPGGQVVTYVELEQRVTALAVRFGAGRKLVALEAESSVQAIIGYLAALRGGHAVAMLPPGDRAVMDEFGGAFEPDIEYRPFDGRWRMVERIGVAEAPLHADLALLLRTSGSTGRGKYVRLSRGAVAANAASIARYLGLTPEDRTALVLPPHYSYGLSVLNSHLEAGASVLLSNRGVADPGFAEIVRQARCTNISGVPYSYELMEKTGFRNEEIATLRFMTVAGGRMAPELVRTWREHLERDGRKLFVMYGQTEATARIAYVPPERLAGREDCIGIAIPGGALRVLGEDGETVAAGATGELAYRGPNVMMGYAEDRADLSRGAEVDELMTGDLAVRDADGLLRIVGRRKRMSKIAGLRISHEAIEHALAAEGMVAAVGGDDERLVAAFVSEQAADMVTRLMAKASGLSRLQIEAFPVPELPRLPSGKVDHVGVTRMADARRGASGESIAQVFRRAFYPRRVAEADSFQTLGGDSLLYVQLSCAIEQKLGHLPDGWDRIPLGGLARLRPVKASGKTIDSALLLRALAITLVVVHHATLWPIPGGAAAMLLLAGFGFARFQSGPLFRGEGRRLLLSVMAMLAVYWPIVAGFSIARGEALWPSFLLVGNLALVDAARMMPYLYWFVEAYTQLVLLWVGLFALPPVRRWAAGSPFLFGMAFLATAVAGKYAVPLVWNVGAVRIFTLPDVLYMAVLGWCAGFADDWRKRAVLIAASAAILPLVAWTGGNWTGSWVKSWILLGTVLALLFSPRVRLPAPVARAVLSLAAAGFHIYLFHRILPELFLPQPVPGQVDPVAATIAIVSGVAVGLAAYHLQLKLTSMLERLRQRGQPSSAAALG